MAATAGVLVVDDHPLFRTGLISVLDNERSLDVVGQTDRLDGVIEYIGMATVDLVILDIMLPGEDGIAITRIVRERAPNARVLGLSVLDEPIRIAELLRAGASGFVHKTQPVAEILEAIHVTLAGESYIMPALRPKLEGLLNGAKLPLDALTARERQVFSLLVQGYSNDRAAGLLGVSPRTVETHRQRVMKKLDAHSVAELVRLAVRWGKVQLS